jgi:signal transduction histidine kinase
MSLWRRVTPSITWVSILTAVIGTVATLAVTTVWVLDRFAEHEQVLGRYFASDAYRQGCVWGMVPEERTLENGDRLRVFDWSALPAGSTGPDRELLGEIEGGALSASRLMLFEEGGGGGAMLLRLAPSGPCSLVELRWWVPRSTRLRLVFNVVTLAAIGALLTALLGAVFWIRPLIVRLQALDAAAKRDLEERHAELQRHLADIAHDLKTPLTAVQLTLEQAVRAEPGADTQSMVTRCLDDCVYLAAMIDNLRVGTQLRDGLDPRAVETGADLTAPVAQVTRRLEVLARHKGVELNMASPEHEVRCACRPLVLERVIDNLVYNALSHVDEGGHVAVLLETQGDRFELTVLDDGPGLPAEERAALGTRQFRGTGAELRAPRGSGLGLSIVVEVARRCGWELRFDANEPRGLRVTITGPQFSAASRSSRGAT